MYAKDTPYIMRATTLDGIRDVMRAFLIGHDVQRYDKGHWVTVPTGYIPDFRHEMYRVRP